MNILFNPLAWLLSNVNQANVQPEADPNPHALDSSGYRYRKISICRQSSTSSEDSQEETEIKSDTLSPNAIPRSTMRQYTGALPKTKGSGSKMPSRLASNLLTPK